jgi:hypothetical protein
MTRKPANEMNRETKPLKGGRLSKDIQNKIGEQLRKMHDDVVQQGVPDRFVELLSKLDTKNDGEKT